MTKRKSFLFVIFLISLLILPACDGGGDDDNSGGANQVSLELGQEKVLGSVSAAVGGDRIFVDLEGDPIDGLEIAIPPGAYQESINFTISHQPITSHSGNEYFDPVTPLITIENGGEYSDEIMTVKIPVTIEDGYHYMAFYYDEATGGLEGIPEVEHDETSLTIATRHFSKILLNRLGYEVTIGTYTVDSGFQVTKDNWQFKNLGTYLSGGGICSGMSIASLYYYTEKKKNLGEPQLFRRYDAETSSLGLDDALAIKLCSEAQVAKGGFDARSFEVWKEINKQKGDVWTYFLFIHAILLTGEPQYVSIYESGGTGHALVVYKKSGNDLYVADPNYPEDATVKIEFDWSSDPSATDPSKLTGHFKPIQSQLNKDTDLINFTQVYYIGKTSVMDWSKLKDLWDELENKTVGKDFPDYDLKIIEKDASGIEREYLLTDGYETNNSVVKVKVEAFQFVPKINVFYEHIGARDNHLEIVEVNLKSGDNELGFLIESERLSNLLDPLGWGWTDFKYINIKLDKEDTPAPPAPLEESSIIVKNTYDEKVLVNIGFWVGEWFRDLDKTITLETGETMTQLISEPGEYRIIVRGYGLNPQEWRWQPTIDLSDQEYTYDFFATQDCNFAKYTVTNQTQYDFWWRFDCDSEVEGCESVSSHHLDVNETDDAYLKPGIFYTLSVHASTGVPNCKGDECYVCWDETFKLNCQGGKTILTGSGTPCD